MYKVTSRSMRQAPAKLIRQFSHDVGHSVETVQGWIIHISCVGQTQFQIWEIPMRTTPQIRHLGVSSEVDEGGRGTGI
ncbi:hypothetical protein KSS87_022401 [Heliosperma pusillum]|nr:hypothetical protein KSS87_022401 [Heliosperma pusillum]